MSVIMHSTYVRAVINRVEDCVMPRPHRAIIVSIDAYRRSSLVNDEQKHRRHHLFA